jgi:hypothetical protein
MEIIDGDPFSEINGSSEQESKKNNCKKKKLYIRILLENIDFKICI